MKTPQIMRYILAATRRIRENPIVLFTANRYLSYAMQFARGILVAKILGPHLLGIWGFLILMQSYLSYTSFGLQYAINVELAVDAISDTKRQEKYIGVAFTTTLFIALFLALLGLGIQVYGGFLFEKFAFSQYAFALSIIVGLIHLRTILTNVYRNYGKLRRIMISELLVAFIPLLAVSAFRGEALITALLVALGLSNLVTVALYTLKSPFPINLHVDLNATWQLVKVGIPLLIYTLSFMLITGVGRTIVSIFYPVEITGFFSLANSITTATLLGLQAIIWVVFPRILSKTREGLPNDVVKGVVDKVTELYSTSVFLAVFAMIFLAPLLFVILPQYKPVLNILRVLLLMQAALSISYGYDTLAMARKQQLKMAGNAIIAVISVGLVSWAIAWLQWDPVWVAIAMFGGGLIYAVLQTRLGSRLLHHNILPSGYLTKNLPVGSLVTVTFFLIGSVVGYYLLFDSLGIIIFIVTRWRSINRLRIFFAGKFLRAE